ncbi:hypothetical protein GQ43DRAFT_259724 [Delitschia confertaspora ATCC 74209]|uniref:Zn(2)-C6 fungal-type domain-containing protein n=1 Tax=Delitschia confertaspora ATCC 74209 TaxID=1513339 RepID=A0A9P4JH24_9PLEO|nr:hypothetical protein GQ43DRAFT_259724 [Delitschia confertaspora ATCC 74209]
MAGPGGGPSRRSHTKSRKGCKTCKKRHIRCDETFPQCRNCTKHQVRCDYMDNPAAIITESPKSQGPNLLWTPEIDSTVELWRQTGQFPFPDLRVYPQPQWQAFSKTDLRLIHHLASISNEMFRNRTSKLAIWTELMPKFLSVAATHPFVMHSVLAFAASHLAWIAQSNETRNLAFHHGGIALKGLHEGIATFSKANSDAVLASSLLLSWQATDWRGWASLVTGTRTVIQAMQPWQHESIFEEYIVRHSPMTHKNLLDPIGSPISQEARREHLAIITDIHHHLQRLQHHLSRYDQEGKWVDQLRGYIERLRSSNPPQTAEEQFSQLYALRKWLFWVPISLLASKRNDITVMVVLGHFYATALAIEPMFPDIGAVFCADLALQPLHEIVQIVSPYQDPSYDTHTQTVSYLIKFPADMAISYQTRKEWLRQQALDAEQQSPYGLDTLNLDLEHHLAHYTYGQSLSPAFAPSPLNFMPPTGLVSGQQSPYLEVPRSAVDTAFTSSYGSPLVSPATAPPGPLPSPYAVHQESSAFSFNSPMGYPSGFVGTPTIWT